jgi:hypothetical protein
MKTSVKFEILNKIENFEKLYGDNPYGIHITTPYSETVEEIDEEIQFFTNLISRKYKLQLKKSELWIHPCLNGYVNEVDSSKFSIKPVAVSVKKFTYGEILKKDEINRDENISNSDLNISNLDYELSTVDTSIDFISESKPIKMLQKIYNSRFFCEDDGEEMKEIKEREDYTDYITIVNSPNFLDNIKPNDKSNYTKSLKEENKDENKDLDYITVKLNILGDNITTKIILNS